MGWPHGRGTVPSIMSMRLYPENDSGVGYPFVFGRPVTQARFVLQKLAEDPISIKIWLAYDQVNDPAQGQLYVPDPLDASSYTVTIAKTPGFVGCWLVAFVFAIDTVIWKED